MGCKWYGSGKEILSHCAPYQVYVNVEEKLMYTNMLDIEKKNYLKHEFVYDKINYNIVQVAYKETIYINGVEYDKQEYLAAIANLKPIAN